MVTIQEIKSTLECEGVMYVGIQKSKQPENELVLFNDFHDSTISVKRQDFSKDKVCWALRLAEIRWGKKMERRLYQKRIKRLAVEFNKHYEPYQFPDFCLLNNLTYWESKRLQSYLLTKIENHPVKITC